MKNFFLFTFSILFINQQDVMSQIIINDFNGPSWKPKGKRINTNNVDVSISNPNFPAALTSLTEDNNSFMSELGLIALLNEKTTSSESNSAPS